MKKLFKNVVLVAVMASMLMSTAMFTSCGGGQTESNDLKIAVYLGEYGQKWINTIARDFEQEFGVTVNIEPSPTLQSEITTRLENGSDDDIFFSHNIEWQKAAALDQLTPLDDLYGMEVENGITFEEKIVDDFLDTSKMYNHYYKVPYTNGVGGLVYNEVMFEEHGWEVPTTYTELLDLCAEIKADGETPFAWSNEDYYWDYLVFDWWAQIDGYEKIQEYIKMDNFNVFDPTANPGQSTALKAWANLVAANNDYSLEDSSGKIYTSAQMSFINGDAAMMPNGQWIEQGMTGNMDESKCVLRMMNSPFLEGAKKDANGEYIDICHSVGAGDSMIIPKNAPNPELAKKFLVFLARDKNMMKFFEETSGAMFAFDYSNCELPADSTKFMQDIWNINRNSKKFGLVSLSEVILNGDVSIEWPIEGTTFYSALYNGSVGGATDEYASFDAWVDDIYADMFKEVKDSWSGWVD